MSRNNIDNELMEMVIQTINDSNLDVSKKLAKLDMIISSSSRAEMNKCPNISTVDLKNEMEALIDDFYDFIETEDSSLNDSDIDINQRNLAESITRKYKRQEYYRYFHNIENISELKETAILCFWILKLKPFTVLKDDSPLRASVNEKFVLNIILATIKYILELSGKSFDMPTRGYIQDVVYSLKYRDLSKEAMILFVDSLAYSYGISIDTWQ